MTSERVKSHPVCIRVSVTILEWLTAKANAAKEIGLDSRTGVATEINQILREKYLSEHGKNPQGK